VIGRIVGIMKEKLNGMLVSVRGHREWGVVL
jgi:hypothetical protein